jgi:Na+/melibiose symporter-like transporter
VLFATYLVDVVGLKPGLAAAAVFIGRTWDYVNDPLAGRLGVELVRRYRVYRLALG